MRYRLSFPARSIVFASAFAFALCLVALPARAVSLIRDADIEYSLMQLAAPILRAAGLGPNSVKILLIDDRSLNAFVIDRSAIYIHTGMLTRLKRAEALQ
jgi:predicted Zn-dependent protease